MTGPKRRRRSEEILRSNQTRDTRGSLFVKYNTLVVRFVWQTPYQPLSPSWIFSAHLTSQDRLGMSSLCHRRTHSEGQFYDRLKVGNDLTAGCTIQLLTHFAQTNRGNLSTRISSHFRHHAISIYYTFKQLFETPQASFVRKNSRSSDAIVSIIWFFMLFLEYDRN